MLVSDLLHMHSSDAVAEREYRTKSRSRPAFGGVDMDTVQSVYARKAQHIAENPIYHQLDEHIRSGNIDPVLLTQRSGMETVAEGHHRIVRAHQLGVERLPVSHDWDSQRHRDDWDVDASPVDIDSVAADYWKNRGA